MSKSYENTSVVKTQTLFADHKPAEEVQKEIIKIESSFDSSDDMDLPCKYVTSQTSSISSRPSRASGEDRHLSVLHETSAAEKEVKPLDLTKLRIPSLKKDDNMKDELKLNIPNNVCSIIMKDSLLNKLGYKRHPNCKPTASIQ